MNVLCQKIITKTQITLAVIRTRGGAETTVEVGSCRKYSREGEKEWIWEMLENDSGLWQSNQGREKDRWAHFHQVSSNTQTL